MNKEELYDKCENMEQLYDKYYLPLLKEKENLEAQLELYTGTLKREHEAIKRLSDLEEENAKILKQNEFLMKDSNVLQSLEMYLKNEMDEFEKDIYPSRYGIIIGNNARILDKIKELKGEVK